MPRVVVISWWSNCLGLRCLGALAEHAPELPLSVVQVGKASAGKARFRERLPPGVVEIDYPENAPGEHGAVLDALAARFRGTDEALWLFDHDVFVEEACGDWLQRTAEQCRDAGACIALRAAPASSVGTSPAFWLAPAALPTATPSFLPVPPRLSAASREPYRLRREGTPARPEQDTLVAAWRYLRERNLVTTFGAFPRHTHLGGLHALAGPLLDAAWLQSPAAREFRRWLSATARRLASFYRLCPAELAALEDPVLLSRLEELERLTSAG